MKDEIPLHSGGVAAAVDPGINATVLEPTANDVLLGRGLPAVQFGGNIRFRHLCNEQQARYLSVQRHAHKDEIARSVVLEVKRRGGRFLRRNGGAGLTNGTILKVAAAVAGSETGETGWIEVDDELAIEKVKQTMRDNKRKSSSVLDISSPAIELQAATASSPPVQQPAARLPQHSPPELGTASTSFDRNSKGTNTSTSYIFRDGNTSTVVEDIPDKARRYPTPETDCPASFSLPYNELPPSLSGNPLLQHRQQYVDLARLLEPPHRLAQRPATRSIDLTQDPLASLFLGRHSYSNLANNEPQQPQPSIELLQLYQKIQALSTDQRASFLLQIPRAYQDLLPLFVADARQNGRSTPLTLTDMLRLRQARSFALQRGDYLRVAQVDHIEQTMQMNTSTTPSPHADPTGLFAAFPGAFSGGSDILSMSFLLNRQQPPQHRPREAASRIPANYEEAAAEAAAEPLMDDRKPAAQPNRAARPEESNAHAAHTNQHTSRAQLQRTECADPSKAGLPLKKRARRDS